MYHASIICEDPVSNDILTLTIQPNLYDALKRYRFARNQEHYGQAPFVSTNQIWRTCQSGTIDAHELRNRSMSFDLA